MPDWTTTTPPQITLLQEQLRAEQDTNLLLRENLADLQLAIEDRGWEAISTMVDLDFTPKARKALRRLCTSMAIANPLIKRGLIVRTGYVWGQGVQIRALAADATAGQQDVNAVVQAFLDANTATWTGSQAHELHERGLGTAGDVFWCAFTDPLTGGVQMRTALPDEVVDIITNPEDRDEPWFYIRHVPGKVVEPSPAGGARTRGQVLKVAHPALTYRPAVRPRTLDGMPIRWDAPIKHVKANAPAGWRFGIPDVYAAVAWARAYKDFLVDWAQLTKALSSIAWQATGGTRSRAQKVAAEVAAASRLPVPPVGATASTAGGTAVGTPDVKLEAVSKSGATIDADSGKPLAGMAAAGLGIPVTILLADPGVTGARAVAETLDLPTLLEMGMRRLLWQAAFTEVLDYVIDQAVIAPRGALRGTTVRDGAGLSTVLAGGVERTLEFEWPSLVEGDPLELVNAIVAASDTTVGRAVPLVLLRVLLGALGVKDADEVLAGVTDEDGQWVDPDATAGDAAIESWRRGEDPASRLTRRGDTAGA